MNHRPNRKGALTMQTILLIGGILAMIGTFAFYFLSLMNLAPILLAAPLLFLAILFTLWLLNTRNQFKGF
jgi:heme O synthase-like polyprenyltransferase